MEKECCSVKVTETENGVCIQLTGDVVKEKAKSILESCCVEDKIKECLSKCCCEDK